MGVSSEKQMDWSHLRHNVHW